MFCFSYLSTSIAKPHIILVTIVFIFDIYKKYKYKIMFNFFKVQVTMFDDPADDIHWLNRFIPRFKNRKNMEATGEDKKKKKLQGMIICL